MAEPSAPRKAPPPPPIQGNHSKVIRYLEGFQWKDVPLEDYKADAEGYKGINRRELAGKRGEGEAQAGCCIWKVGFGGVFYVSPGDPHQFRCPADAKEPFGFLCIVNAQRDRPTAVDGLGVCHICE